MKGGWLVFLIAGVLAPAATAHAHHSFAATYHEDRSQTIEGELVQFIYRNPHSFVHLLVPDVGGNMQRWIVEWGGVAQLNRDGVERYTLKPRDRVTITGRPGRNPEDRRMLMRQIVRPVDGWSWGGEVD